MQDEERLLKDFAPIQQILDLQEVLHSLTANNIEESVTRIISISPSTECLARNIYRFSAIRYMDEDLFANLVLKLKDKTEIEKSLIEHFLFAKRLKCFNFIGKLIEIGINIKINEKERHMYMDKKEKGTFGSDLSRKDVIFRLIKNDDLNGIIEICSDPCFDINERFPCSLSPKAIIFEQTINLACLAAYFGAVKVFKYLIMSGTNMKSSNFTKFAIVGGNCEIIRIIEQNGFKYDYNSISIAIYMHNREIYDWLMEKYPDRNETRSCIESEFVYGIKELSLSQFQIINRIIEIQTVGIKELVEIILLNTNIKPEYLSIALLYGYEDIARILLKNPKVDINWNSNPVYYIDPNCYENTPLYIACYKGMAGIVEELVSRDNIDVNGGAINTMDSEIFGLSSPISAAAINNRLDIVKILLKHPDIKIQCRSSELVPIFETWNDELIQIFIFDRKLGSLDYEHLVKSAAYNNKIDYLKRLLKIPEINVTPALLVSKGLALDILLEYPYININNSYENETILKKAIKSGDRKLIIKVLSQPNIDVSLSKYYVDNISPLVWAIGQRDDEIVDLILKNPTLMINEVINGMSPFLKAFLTENKYVEKITNHPNFSITEIRPHINEVRNSIPQYDLDMMLKMFPELVH